MRIAYGKVKTHNVLLYCHVKVVSSNSLVSFILHIPKILTTVHGALGNEFLIESYNTECQIFKESMNSYKTEEEE
jgi:hypothetical protein